HSCIREVSGRCLFPGRSRAPLFPYTTLFRSVRTESVPGKSPDRKRAISRVPGGCGWVSAVSRTCRGTITPKISQLIGMSAIAVRSEEHTSELQSREKLVCRLLLEKKKRGRST